MGKAKSLIKKLFLTSSYFTIAIGKNGEDNTFFKAEKVLKAREKKWSADPFLFERDGKAWLFYEATLNNKGSIAVSRIKEDFSLTDEKIILQGTHFSYPCVFEKDGEVFLMPENSEVKEVALYRAKEFPYVWEKEQVLLSGDFVDSTFFCYKGKSYVSTYKKQEMSEAVEPHVYRVEFDDEGRFLLTELVWENYNPFKVRGAGNYFMRDGKLLRPAQISSYNSYGEGLAFFEVEIDGNNYTENLVEEVDISKVNASVRFKDGIHTYNFSDGYKVVDIRKRGFNLFKPLKKIFRKVFGKR